jgi:hypothetical protein
MDHKHKNLYHMEGSHQILRKDAKVVGLVGAVAKSGKQLLALNMHYDKLEVRVSGTKETKRFIEEMHPFCTNETEWLQFRSLKMRFAMQIWLLQQRRQRRL